MEEIKVKKLAKDVELPYQATKGSAGADLRAYFDDENGEKVEKVVLYPQQEMCINTKLAFQLPKGTVMFLFPRSSMGIKKKLVLLNTVGVLDDDYTGECLLFVKNMGDEKVEILNGERLAQAVVVPYITPNYVKVDELEETERGGNGFGSTGVL